MVIGGVRIHLSQVIRGLFLLAGILAFSSDAMASGTFSSSGTTTDASSQSADPKRPNKDWGALTISAVIVNGMVKVAGVDYEVVNQGTSEAEVFFFNPLPSGVSVVINGTTTNDGHHWKRYV